MPAALKLRGPCAAARSGRRVSERRGRRARRRNGRSGADGRGTIDLLERMVQQDV
jgi:hypothetical protein